ncbi:hypothetical protein Droror1_Dr00009043, partial [Drosera rotundifolia]
MELLRKGVEKYPKGTSGRWEVISVYIGTGRSVDEILMATKTSLLQEPKPDVCIASLQSTREMEERGSSAEKTTPKADAVKPPPGDPVDQLPMEMNPAKLAPFGSIQDRRSAVQENALVEAMKTFPTKLFCCGSRVPVAVLWKMVDQSKKKFCKTFQL